MILSDEYEVAFADDLPWHKFSIKWPVTDLSQAVFSEVDLVRSLDLSLYSVVRMPCNSNVSV